MSFIYVGRLDELKGIKLLFEAWKMMGDRAPELKVCGLGPLEDWCKDYINKHYLKTVSMMGLISNEEAKKLMGDSEALILPTQWYEGFPMTILETYSVGTPVVASDLGNVGSVVKEGITGWKFEAGSVNGLIEAVRRWTDISESVKKVYEEKYTAETNYWQLMEIYERLSV